MPMTGFPVFLLNLVFLPIVHRAIHFPFRPEAPDLYLCPDMVSLGQPAASLGFPAGTAVPGYPIHVMHCPSVALTPGYVTSPSVPIHIRAASLMNTCC